MIMSISHVIADGHTAYSLQSMLSDTTEVKRMNPVRKFQALPSIDAALGGKENSEFVTKPSPWFIMNVVRGE